MASRNITVVPEFRALDLNKSTILKILREHSVLSTHAIAFEYYGEWIFSPFKAQRRERSHSYVTRVATQQGWKKTPPEYMKAIAWVLTTQTITR